jgi:hypothetical protein
LALEPSPWSELALQPVAVVVVAAAAAVVHNNCRECFSKSPESVHNHQELVFPPLKITLVFFLCFLSIIGRSFRLA